MNSNDRQPGRLLSERSMGDGDRRAYNTESKSEPPYGRGLKGNRVENPGESEIRSELKQPDRIVRDSTRKKPVVAPGHWVSEADADSLENEKQ